MRGFFDSAQEPQLSDTVAAGAYVMELALLGEVLEEVKWMGGFAPGEHHGDELLAGEVSWKFGLDEDDYFVHNVKGSKVQWFKGSNVQGFLIRNLTCWRLLPSLR